MASARPGVEVVPSCSRYIAYWTRVAAVARRIGARRSGQGSALLLPIASGLKRDFSELVLLRRPRVNCAWLLLVQRLLLVIRWILTPFLAEHWPIVTGLAVHWRRGVADWCLRRCGSERSSS